MPSIFPESPFEVAGSGFEIGELHFNAAEVPVVYAGLALSGPRNAAMGCANRPSWVVQDPRVSTKMVIGGTRYGLRCNVSAGWPVVTRRSR